MINPKPLYLFQLVLLCFSTAQVHGDCSSWSDWSSCSVTCGEGIEHRSRSCVTEHQSHDDCVTGPTLETKKCKLERCPVSYEALGCFKDKVKSRALPTVVKNLRPYIDWKNMNKTVRACAELVLEKGWKIFGIQFYGECWSGPDVENTYNKHGKSSKCWEGVGKGMTNFVYKIKEDREIAIKM